MLELSDGRKIERRERRDGDDCLECPFDISKMELLVNRGPENASKLIFLKTQECVQFAEGVLSDVTGYSLRLLSWQRDLHKVTFAVSFFGRRRRGAFMGSGFPATANPLASDTQESTDLPDLPPGLGPLWTPEVAAKEPEKCPECKGSGKIELFTSSHDCGCCGGKGVL